MYEATFPTGGDYLVHTGFRRNGQMVDVLDTHTHTVAGHRPTPVAVPAADVRTWTDGSTFDHRHAETYDGAGRPVLALPGTWFGPELDLHVRFDRPGAHRLGAEGELADGAVVTALFVVHAAVAPAADGGRRSPGRAHRPVSASARPSFTAAASAAWSRSLRSA